tara:strand:- start:824 stop:1012 length:189 start_codon:yes stop_codon:yes gene_type:complete
MKDNPYILEETHYMESSSSSELKYRVYKINYQMSTRKEKERCSGYKINYQITYYMPISRGVT